MLNEILRAEADAILGVMTSVDKYRFDYLVELLSELKGKVIVTGVGKSAIAARKIASTLATCRICSFFLDPIGLFHGELGAIGKHDLIVLISQSGDTEELIRLLPVLPKGCSIWSIVGCQKSTLGRLPTSLFTGVIADPVLDVPTASSSAAVALGDALAISVAMRCNLTNEHLGHNHPGGAIGKRAGSLV